MSSLKIKHIASNYEVTSQSQTSKTVWEAEITLGKLLKPQDKQRLYHLLSTLLNAGLGMMDCMEVVIDQSEKKVVREILISLKTNLEEGKSLSESLAIESEHFSSFEVYSIQMGEQTGQMADIMDHLASYYEKQIRLRRKITQALSYPVAVIIVASLVLTFMIAFVVPMFEDIFKRFDTELPPITQFILNTSQFLQSNGGLILGGILGTAIIFFLIRQKPAFKKITSLIILNIPVMGKLMLKLHLSRFCYTFSLLLLAKVNMDKSLELLDKVISFYPIQTAVSHIHQKIIEGNTLYDAFIQHSIFPKYLTQIIKVGEKTARLDQMLQNLAKSLEEESEAGIGQFTQFLEPVLIVILGGMVAVILVSMYLPMFELSNAIG
ncbi:MAG: type II secretion system F family protein [Bacteroidetes bacterium]|nr:type II secretion system F family protein [Bacteroidota bacterium]